MSNSERRAPYKPVGYSTVSPYLVIAGAADTIAFLSLVFGAEEVRRFATPDGTVGHAEVRIEDTVIMLAESVENWPPVPAHVHVYVADVDATYGRAVAAGAESIREPVQREGEADRRCGVRGPGGVTWWIATQVAGQAAGQVAGQ
jgi:uncharacterized glyoxalase superfamily protein PhnB